MNTSQANPAMPNGNTCPQCGAALPASALAGLCPACLLRQGAAGDTDTGPRATVFVPPSPAELAAKFPQLEILELLGRGGMGAVYKARQKQLDRIVALKILPPAVARDPSFAERFAREAKALAKLNHPNIVTLYEFGQADGLFYFLMEFMDGMNLRQLLNAGRVTPKEALAIVPPICDALQFAHDRGIVHRDIKPENILLSKGGQVKIADFGVAKIVAREPAATTAGGTLAPPSTQTEAGLVMGTPPYMAPEQTAHPSEVDHRADIYSLGVVFYQMLTGELPKGKFEAPSKKVVIDVRLDEVVLRALEKEPERRYQHVSEVKTQVETIATTPAPSNAGAATVPSPTVRQPLSVAGKISCLFALMICAIAIPIALASPYPWRQFGLLFGILGIVIALLKLAGKWPFPSLLFPAGTPLAAGVPALSKLVQLAANPLPVLQFWQALEDEDYARAWERAAPYFQRDVGKDEWVARMEKNRRPLGKAVRREQFPLHWLNVGIRHETRCKTTFASERTAMETAVAALQPNGEWRVESYRLDLIEVAPVTPLGGIPASASPAQKPPEGGPPTPTTPAVNKSGMVHILEIFFGITFTSPAAIRLGNLSALGFLGSIGVLGNLPFPGWHRCFGFFGFFGFFGLIGLAFIVERFRTIVVVGRRGGRAVIHWPGALLVFMISLVAGESVTALGSLAIVNRIDPLPIAMVFVSVVASIAAIIIGKRMATPLEKLKPLEEPAKDGTPTVGVPASAGPEPMPPQGGTPTGAGAKRATASLPLFAEYGGRRQLYWPGVLMFCGTIGLMVLAMNLAISLALWLINAPVRLTFQPGELALVLMLMAACAVMRKAAMKLGARVVARPGSAPAGKVSTARKVIVRVFGMAVAAAVAAGVALVIMALTKWMHTVSKTASTDGNSLADMDRVVVWIVIAVAAGLFIIHRVRRAGKRPLGSASGSAVAAPQGIPNPPEPKADWTTWSPFQPPLVREVCAHMTEAETREATTRSVLDGLWKAGTVLGPFFSIHFVPSPLGWIYGIGIFVVGLSFLPLWRKIEREFLCTTAWARQQGLRPDQLRGFAAPSLSEPRGRIAQWYARRWRTLLFRDLPVVIVIVIVLHAFVIASYRAETDAVSPEIPRGSWMLVYKLACTFGPGDIIVHRREGKFIVGRVVEAGPRDGVVRVQRRQASPESVAAANIIGKVVFNTRAGTSSDRQPAEKMPGPEIERVEVSKDQAVVKQRRFNGGGMIFTFGSMANRWSPGSVYFDHIFDVTLEWPWFRRHDANWVIKTRHGIYASYRLDGPPGPMLGKIVFHPGTPAPEADGSYVIGEFKSETGVTLPISVRLEKQNTPATEKAPTPQGGAVSNPPITSGQADVNSPARIVSVLPWIIVVVVVAVSLFIIRRFRPVVKRPQAGPPVSPFAHLSQPPSLAGTSSPRVLNVGNCRLTTPECLATFAQQFFFYWVNRGQLVLNERHLTFSGAGMHTVIPLAAIRDLSVGRFPRVMHPAGLHFLSVTYDDGGQSRRIILSPFESLIGPPSYFNQLVARWFDAIRAAATAATGHAPASTPAEKLGTPSSSIGIVTLLLSLLLMGFIPFVVIFSMPRIVGSFRQPEPPRVPLMQMPPAAPADVTPPVTPQIRWVDVSRDRAVVKGWGLENSRIVISVGDEGNWSCNFATNTYFNAFIEPEHGVLKLTVKDPVRPILALTPTNAGPIKFDRGRFVFNEGRVSPWTASIRVGEFQPETGAPLPITVRLETLGKAGSKVDLELVHPANEAARPVEVIRKKFPL